MLMNLRVFLLSFIVFAAVAVKAVNPTGTIPIVYINTQGSVPIVDKVTKIPATMRITVPEGYTTLNGRTAENLSGISLTIRGRGNASWRMDKKPYKLKFEEKTAVLGMPKSKHFALIPYAVNLISYGCVAGMELARCTGQSWAPYSEPVEVMLNNEYIGRYFMVESVKIDKNRLNIAEQPDLNEDDSILDGGWLVEIDNTTDEAQIVIPETDDMNLRVTYHTPEEVSPKQKQWLIDRFTEMNAAIYSGDASGEAWAKYIDPASVARYFIVREVLGDTDGFNGSFYLHKDLGEGSKWVFGPMWDLSLDTKYDWIFNDHPSYSQVHWIEPMFYTDIFFENLVEQWGNIKGRMQQVYDYIDRLGELTRYADIANNERWPQYESANSIERADHSKRVISNNMDWIDDEIAYMAGMGAAVRDDNAPVISFVGDKCRVGLVSGEVRVDIFRPDGNAVARMVRKGGDVIDTSAFGKGVFIVRASMGAARGTTLKVVNM